MLTASEDQSELVQAVKLGCSGIVLKGTAPDLIVKGIRKVHAGEIWLDAYVTAAAMRQFQSGGELSARDGLFLLIAHTPIPATIPANAGARTSSDSHAPY